MAGKNLNLMTGIKSKELILAKNLMYKGKLEEALNTVINFENEEAITPNDKLSACILKGQIYAYKFQYNEAAKAGEIAYKMSQNQNKVYESIDALILKSFSLFRAEFDNSLDFVLEAEKLIDSNTKISTSEISRQKGELLHVKALIYHLKSEYAKALKLALSCLELQEGSGLEKLPLSRTLILIAFIYQIIGKLDKSQDLLIKSLEIIKKLGDKEGIAAVFTLMGGIEYYKGNFDQALNNCKHGYSLNVRSYTKWKAMFYMGAICKERGQLNQGLKYYEEANKIAEETDNIISLMGNTMLIGTIYRMKGDYEKALKHLTSSLELSEKKKIQGTTMISLFNLTLLHIDKNSRELAQQYVNRLKELADQTESKLFNQAYTLAKALLLKTSGLSRNRVKAETLLKQIIEEEIVLIGFYVLALVFLCDYLLEELYTSNDTKILNEIRPLITRLLQLAEKQNSYSWLAETKLLQAKLALVQLNMEEAQKLMTEAQHVADSHGLDLLAIMISSDHDILLQQLNTWKELEKNNAPLSKRIKLASIEGVLDRIQGKRAIEPPELVSEESVVLLIMAAGGVPVFSYPFTDEWKRDNELFGSFLSAFTSFSDEFFSEGFDRAKFGQYTVLLKSVADFSVCYLFKGQTYPASQKLTQFSEQIQNSTSIWQSLNKHFQMSQVLEINEFPPLKNLLTDIFLTKNSE